MKRALTLTTLILAATCVGGFVATDSAYAQWWGPGPQWWNPTVQQHHVGGGYFDPWGNHHSFHGRQNHRASYYSPWRNWRVSPTQNVNQTWVDAQGRTHHRHGEQWIGADGRPHGDIQHDVTQTDPWGNSHTESDRTLFMVRPEGGNNNNNAPGQSVN